MRFSAPLGVAIVAAGTLIATATLAHVTLEVRQSQIDAGYRAVFRVPHGCSGKATTRVRVQIPDGVIAAKPMPKPGWTLEVVKGAYATPTMYHGTKLTEGTREVSWRGSLDDDNYDEFVISTYITDQVKPGAMLYFPVVQECGDAVDRWIEIPKDNETLPKPAPGVRTMPKP
jgi:uncharacterized protein YcnI